VNVWIDKITPYAIVILKIKHLVHVLISGVFGSAQNQWHRHFIEAPKCNFCQNRDVIQ
jgi:hypothetical protein